MRCRKYDIRIGHKSGPNLLSAPDSLSYKAAVAIVKSMERKGYAIDFYHKFSAMAYHYYPCWVHDYANCYEKLDHIPSSCIVLMVHVIGFMTIMLVYQLL